MGWLAGYTYRKPITLSRASGAVTNYQMKLLLGESSGATGEDVDCGGKCLSNFNDIRFTTSDGTTLLDYSIEEPITGTTPNQLATIWIEFDSIGTGDTTFYMYYGKADAPAVSNGANTFILFEDFEWGNDEDDLTTSGGSVTWTAVQGAAKIDTAKAYGGAKAARFGAAATYPIYTTPITADANRSIQFRFYKTAANQNGPNVTQGDGTERWVVQFDQTQSLYYYGESPTDSTANCTADTWQLLEVNNFNFTPEGSFSIWLNGVNVANPTGMYDTATLANTLRMLNAETVAGRDIWIDNFIVRNWRAVEPAWGAWGSEEEEFLKIYSEATIKTNGSYAMKGIAAQTTSLNKTRTRTLSSPIDLSNINTLYLDIRASRTGSNIKIGLHDSGGTTTEITPNIVSADTFQQVTWDISGVANANKDAIDKIIITIVNADTENTFYIDNFCY